MHRRSTDCARYIDELDSHAADRYIRGRKTCSKAGLEVLWLPTETDFNPDRDRDRSEVVLGFSRRDDHT